VVIVENKTMPKEDIPSGVVVHCHNKGWMDIDGMAVWGEKVSTEPLCSSATVSVHILTKVFTTQNNYCGSDSWRPYQDIGPVRHFCYSVIQEPCL